jgi:hypothetical protein
VAQTDPWGVPNKQLPDELALSIRHAAAAGRTPAEIAANLGLHRGTVYRIIRGDAYPDVGGPTSRRARVQPGMTQAHLRAEARRRIRDRTEVADSGCWLWTGKTSPKGYASLHFNGRMRQAHRLAYEAFVGPIPAGLEVDHACHSVVAADCYATNDDPHRRCCRPDHLRLVDHATNVRAARRLPPEACCHGHPYDEANTQFRITREGAVTRRWSSPRTWCARWPPGDPVVRG